VTQINVSGKGDCQVVSICRKLLEIDDFRSINPVSSFAERELAYYVYSQILWAFATRLRCSGFEREKAFELA